MLFKMCNVTSCTHTRSLTRILASVGDHFSIAILESSLSRYFVVCIWVIWNWRISATVGWINAARNELWELVTLCRPNPIWQPVCSLSFSACDAELIWRVNWVVKCVDHRSLKSLTLGCCQAAVLVQVWYVKDPIWKKFDLWLLLCYSLNWKAWKLNF